MLCEDQVINRYGAKFFVGQLVRIVSIHGDTEDEDVNKLGVIDENYSSFRKEGKCLG